MAAIDLVTRKLHGARRGRLSLLGSDSEEEGVPEAASDSEEERPALLPLNDVLCEVPSSLSALLDLVLPRLQSRSAVKGVSLEDQQNFVSILVGELSSQFAVIAHQIDDPFLSPQKNKRLHRMVVVEVCRILESLYTEYIGKAARLHPEGTFSVAANMSRLRAELAVHANKSINLLAIRRQVLDQLRGPLTSHPSTLPPMPRWKPQKRYRHTTNIDHLDLDAPLTSKLSRFGVRLESRAVRRRVQQLKGRMPQHTSQGLPEDLRSESEGFLSADESGELVESELDIPCQLYHAPSMPELYGNFLLCDWGLVTRTPYHIPSPDDRRRENRHRSLDTERRLSIDSNMDLKCVDSDDKLSGKQLGDFTREDLTFDLSQLSYQPLALRHSTTHDDIDPLLQACVHGLSDKQVQRLAAHDLKEKKEKEEKERLRAKEEEEERERMQRHGQDVPSLAAVEQMNYITLHHSHHNHLTLPHTSETYVGQTVSEQLVHVSHHTRHQVSQHTRHQVSQHTESHEDLQSPHDSAPLAGGDTQGSMLGAVSSNPSRSSFALDAVSESDDVQNTAFESNSVQIYSPTFSPAAQVIHAASAAQVIHAGSGAIGELNVAESGFSAMEGSGSMVRDQGTSRSSFGSGRSAQLEGKEEGRGGGERGKTERKRVQEEQIVSDTHFLFSDSKCAGFIQDQITDDEEEEERAEEWEAEEEEEGEGVSEPPPQPAVITTRINDKVIRTSDVCVTERTPLNSLRLKPYGPIWNELTGDIDLKTIDEMDSNLKEPLEMKILFDALSSTVPKDYLDIEKDPSLIPAMTEAVDIDVSRFMASTTLSSGSRHRVANHRLKRATSPPWGSRENQEQWRTSNQYTGSLPHKKMQRSAVLATGRSKEMQQYKSWLKWWSCTVSPEDYLMFVAQEESDYLHLIHHLYDSDSSESEVEEEKAKRERLARLHNKLQAKRARRQEVQCRKGYHEKGMWNVNTVMMGGLGGGLGSSSSEEEMEDEVKQLEGDGKQGGVELSGQQRLERLWQCLHMSTEDRVDMAVKYSSPQYALHMRQALDLWEEAYTEIEKREHLLAKLEAFEKTASDPSRLFTKRPQQTATTRLQEAKTRSQLHSALDAQDKLVSQILLRLHREYADTLTYKGRLYEEKMRYDRTEMLYWLQQERREAALADATLSPDGKGESITVVVPTLNISI